jgi:hypothetical protein
MGVSGPRIGVIFRVKKPRQNSDASDLRAEIGKGGGA